MTRFVHVGDVHLQAGHSRNADRLQALDQIIAEGLALEQLGAWMIPGDLFHVKSTIADRNDLAPRLLQMAAKAPVVIVRGNHDQPGDLDIFARLFGRWPITVVLQPGVELVTLATGETAAIACVPNPDKHGLVAAGVAPGDIAKTAAELLDVIFMQLAHELSTARVSGAIPIGLGHFNTRGAIASTGQPQIGHEQEVDRVSIDRLGVVYFGLSHIHKAQEVGSGIYAGSIAAMDHGETEAKSYNVVECIRQGSVWGASWHRRPIKTPPMFHVALEMTPRGPELLDPDFGEIHHRFDARRWDGCDVRARIEYKASERASLDVEGVKALFAGALRLKVETVAIIDRDVRAPEVAAAKTLSAKLAAYRKEPTLPPSLEAKLALLQQPDPAVALEAAKARLAAIVATKKETVAA